jgi:hypothetical protein
MINKAQGLDKVFKNMHFSDSLAPTNTLRTVLWN